MQSKENKQMCFINHSEDISVYERHRVWQPSTDLVETNRHFIVKIEISGMNNEDFSINFHKGVLSISGYREGKNIDGFFHQMEIPYGDFLTIVKIPYDIQVNAIEAYYENGFLTVMLPKKDPIHIKINKK